MVKQTKTGLPKATPFPTAGSWWANSQRNAMVLGILAVLLYATSLTHGFVLDDGMMISKNVFTTKGISGFADILTTDNFTGFYQESVDQVKVAGGRYRPLSLLLFATIFQFFGDNPFPYHLFQVLVFGILCAFLYKVIRYVVMPSLDEASATLFSLVTTGLFVVHPVHTEVVNNVKSLDEVLALLLSVSALYLAVRFQDTGRSRLAAFSGIAFFLGLMAKEIAVIFLLLVPLAMYIRQRGRKPGPGGTGRIAFALAFAFGIYFTIRYAVLGWSVGDAPLDLINNPFIKYQGNGWVACAADEKMAMIFHALWTYLSLLVFPLKLTTDYYPRMIDVITFTDTGARLGFLAYSLLGLLALISFWYTRRVWLAFGILAFLMGISLVSNILFPIGTHLAERFLFTPSLGFCLAVAALVTPLMISRRNRLIPAATLCIALGLLFSIRTLIRNPDFRSNEILFEKDLQVSVRSAKMHNGYGAILAEKGLRAGTPEEARQYAQKALDQLNQALTIHPTYIEAFYMRGNVFFMLGQYESAVGDYQRCLGLNPNFKEAYGNYALSMREAARVILDQGGDTQRAITLLEQSLQLFPNEAPTRDLLSKARALQGQ